ncbi:DUF2058 domain-containing protein [Thiorhodovibrio frisius]|uniref:Nucleoprotein/polynucleotide-associated enzyme n=1 Tax=Thiorhodovibrio frisius TaxID=631362 RepID=H8Z0D3_9GAMM|nr:DUF2058 domain-containing protein [Thiorhodovibrio frisius]EIC21234.1 hypothetical protein Thi970DRAFT_01423 [Thiorhodovibrio frisius]WPL23810.1 hypothetical protein Thiofri_04013 [Thiorhodovibrio frisius]
MGNSLQDQLVKAGLASTQKAKQTKSKKRKQRRQGDDRETVERREAVARTEAEKATRDRELNRQREEEAQQKAAQSALRELIHRHRVARAHGDLAYNFADGAALKRLYVNAEQHAALVAGQLAIVRQDNFYELIPAETAARVAERDPERILVWNQGGDSAADDSEYADYQVPDDLMW